MTLPSKRVLIAGGAGAVLLMWVLFWGLPSWVNRRGTTTGTTSADTTAEGRRINATLFFVSQDAQSLVPVRREVPFAATTAEQARQIVVGQLGEPPATLHSPIPRGTTVRGVFVSEEGVAFVDLSAEAAASHPGGSTAEALTIYSIVNAVIVSLPDVRAVQILVDGREVETLAGHVDLRHPLPKNMTWVTSQ